MESADNFVQKSDKFIVDANRQLQTMSQQLTDFRSELVVKIENLENAQKADSNTFVDETWAQVVMKGVSKTNSLLVPSVIKAEAEEIKERSLNFIISNFKCENTRDMKTEFVKQCKGIPQLAPDLKVEDIGFIRKINDHGKFLVHFINSQQRNTIFSKRFLLGKQIQIYVDLDLTHLQ